MQLHIMSTIPKNVSEKLVRKAMHFYGDQLLGRLNSKVKIYLDFRSIGTYADCSWLDSNYRPREFEININRKTYGRALYCYLAHEMVHVQQFVTNRMFDYAGGNRVRFEKKVYEGIKETDLLGSGSGSSSYYWFPWEVEARGLEAALANDFIAHYNLSKYDLRAESLKKDGKRSRI